MSGTEAAVGPPAPEEDAARPAPPTEAPAAGHARRFWSTRRLPAALVSAVVLGAAGILLYDVSAVRAHRPAMGWRRRLARELAARPLDDAWIVVGAAAAVLAGLWLIALALTPGLRGVLPMRRDNPDVRAGLDRKAAALVLRDRAMRVSGVRSVRVDVGRRRVRARAQSHFRDLDEVRADLDSVLADGVDRLGLARRPALSVSVRRPAKK
ncbi:DUF6286 domain-containing protein [Streptomyces sp. ISL-11]|uniref:DUF6286 domain-containing protein n=1 Tax=Streptomyces sp. ISL-11 TaxID=2819174 RepID=UPI001BE9302F|nr:DUF6286 domain-containing protein [Streptomyces sp. ISL-11]MBT2384224.1 hypothetical protein [Streptomyces sp. ISL-11]